MFKKLSRSVKCAETNFVGNMEVTTSDIYLFRQQNVTSKRETLLQNNRTHVTDLYETGLLISYALRWTGSFVKLCFFCTYKKQALYVGGGYRFSSLSTREYSEYGSNSNYYTTLWFNEVCYHSIQTGQFIIDTNVNFHFETENSLYDVWKEKISRRKFLPVY